MNVKLQPRRVKGSCMKKTEKQNLFYISSQKNKQTNKHNYVLWNFKNRNKNNLSKTKITSLGDSPPWQRADAY